VGEDAEAWHEGPMRSEGKASKFADKGKCAQRGYEDELVLAMERADKRDVSNLSRGDSDVIYVYVSATIQCGNKSYGLEGRLAVLVSSKKTLRSLNNAPPNMGARGN
jgi:hypothetical protein